MNVFFFLKFHFGADVFISNSSSHCCNWCQNIRYSGCLKVDRPIQIYNTFSLKLRPRMLCHGFCEDHASTQILFGSTTIPSAVCLAILRCVLLLHCSPPIATHLYHAHLRPLYINARQYQPCPLITAAAHPQLKIFNAHRPSPANLPTVPITVQHIYQPALFVLQP